MKKISTAIAVAFGAAALAACNQSPQEQAADNIEANAEIVADNLEDAADAVEANGEAAADSVRDGADADGNSAN